jgi:hypothetical protein
MTGQASIERPPPAGANDAAPRRSSVALAQMTPASSHRLSSTVPSW